MVKNVNRINAKKFLYGIIILVIGVTIGWLFFGNDSHDHSKEVVEQDGTIWTCSMHPQIRKNEPGQCPICGMDLIPLITSGDDENPMEVKMSPTAMQLANIQTAIVKMEKPIKSVRMNGKVKADERFISSQTVHISGRIERLLVSFTGEMVNKGQVLAYIYSPELITAQEELLEANKIKGQQPALLEAAKNKLRNLKVTNKQIGEILASGIPHEQFPILADVSGVVINKRVSLGDYLMKGQSLFEIADLTRVWILFDVYESDLPWVKKGSEVQFTLQSLPGEDFEGKISFVDPVINSKTRVASARIEMYNRSGKLLPDMFVKGEIRSPIQDQKEALVVPKSAVMWTGKRSVVYVKHVRSNEVSFIMREVSLGDAIGDSYVIDNGLEEGEEIAVNGTFSIDAAAQLEGKPSMMNPDGGTKIKGHDHSKM